MARITNPRQRGVINRGYTGHEHIDTFGILNMNGRIYDPLTAMFFSVDPVLYKGNWLSYNKYAYCYGNPLKYNDPDGKNPLVIAGIVVGFMYLKAAHDYAPKENQGNPLKWAWKPGDWLKPSPSNPNGGIPYFEIEVGASTDGSGAHGYFSFGNPNQPMPTIGYHADYGWGGGYNQYGNTSMYYPNYNYNAPEQAGLRAEQEARTQSSTHNVFSKIWNSGISRFIIADAYYVSGSLDLTFIGGGGYEGGGAFVLRGEDAGKVYGFSTLKAKVGAHLSAGVNFGSSSYFGVVDNFDFDATFRGSASGIEGDYVIGYSLSGSDRDQFGSTLISRSLGVGPGIGASVYRSKTQLSKGYKFW